MRGEKGAGKRLRATMLKGSHFVFPMEIEKSGSDVSRLLGWIGGKRSLSSLYPTPVCLLGAEDSSCTFQTSMGNTRLKLELSPTGKCDIAPSSGCGYTKHSALCCDMTG